MLASVRCGCLKRAVEPKREHFPSRENDIMLERLFKLSERNTNLRTEVLAGLATFMALSYIIFVQPAVLGMTGMDFGAVMVATCISSAIACFLMALMTNLPIALAPAMGHNFFFALTVCGAVAHAGLGFTWQEALAANCISGLIFLLLAVAGLHRYLVDALPESLRYAIAVGIGLLIAFVGLQWAGIVVHHPATYVTLGDPRCGVVLLAVFGLLLAATLAGLHIRGAILIAIVTTAAAGLAASHFFGSSMGYRLVQPYQGIVGLPPSIKPTLLKFLGGFGSLFTDHSIAEIATVIFIFLILDLFDTLGTLVGLCEVAGLSRDGKIPHLREAMTADAIATVAGTALGTSTVTSYVESAAGISAGGRTGLTAIVTGICLLAALPFAPLVQMIGQSVEVPAAAVGAVASPSETLQFRPVIAPVLILIGVYMLPVIRNINWTDMTEAVPAFMTIVIMQMGLSISHGIAWGMISYTILKICTGRARQLHPLLVFFTVLFVLFLFVHHA